MRVSVLAKQCDVTIASVKYYIRVGLLHPGRVQSATRADYDESHVERVRLIRTLAEVGGLSIERIKEVVTALDHPPASRPELLRTAHRVLRDNDRRPVSASARRLAEHVVPAGEPGEGAPHERRPSPATLALGRAITIAETAGWPVTTEALDAWSQALSRVAEIDAADLAEVAPGEALQHVIVGNVLTDPILTALRRVAQERLSAERVGAEHLADGASEQ